MSTSGESIPESFKTKFEISPQLNLLIRQMGINNMRDVIEPGITNDELDMLLNKIKLDPSKDRYLMEIVNVIVDREKITDKDELINLKIKVLLDNLSKKMCKCVYKTKNVGLCRSSIFKKRNLDFITYECGDNPKDELLYNYGLGPILKPSVRGNSIILRRPIERGEGLKSIEAISSPVLEVKSKTPIKEVKKTKTPVKTVDYSIPEEKSDHLSAQVKLTDIESKPLKPLNIDCSSFDKYTCRKPCKWNGFKCV